MKRQNSGLQKLRRKSPAYETKIANPSGDLDSIMTPEFYATYTALHTELKRQMEEWEQLHKELE